MRISIVYDKNGEKMTLTSTQPTKRKITYLLPGLFENNANLEGSVRVTYARGYHNEFDFKGQQDLEDKLWPCMEKGLLDGFDG